MVQIFDYGGEILKSSDLNKIYCVVDFFVVLFYYVEQGFNVLVCYFIDYIIFCCMIIFVRSNYVDNRILQFYEVVVLLFLEIVLVRRN